MINVVNAKTDLVGSIVISDITIYVMKQMNIDVGSISSIIYCVFLLNSMDINEGNTLTMMLVENRARITNRLFSIFTPENIVYS